MVTPNFGVKLFSKSSTFWEVVTVNRGARTLGNRRKVSLLVGILRVTCFQAIQGMPKPGGRNFQKSANLKGCLVNFKMVLADCSYKRRSVIGFDLCKIIQV